MSSVSYYCKWNIQSMISCSDEAKRSQFWKSIEHQIVNQNMNCVWCEHSLPHPWQICSGSSHFSPQCATYTPQRLILCCDLYSRKHEIQGCILCTTRFTSGVTLYQTNGSPCTVALPAQHLKLTLWTVQEMKWISALSFMFSLKRSIKHGAQLIWQT